MAANCRGVRARAPLPTPPPGENKGSRPRRSRRTAREGSRAPCRSRGDRAPERKAFEARPERWGPRGAKKRGGAEKMNSCASRAHTSDFHFAASGPLPAHPTRRPGPLFLPLTRGPDPHPPAAPRDGGRGPWAKTRALPRPRRRERRTAAGRDAACEFRSSGGFRFRWGAGVLYKWGIEFFIYFYEPDLKL